MGFLPAVTLSVLSGACLLLAFPPYDQGYLAFVALVPAIVARRRLARPGWEAGVVAALPWTLWLLCTAARMWPGLWWLKALPVAIGIVLFAIFSRLRGPGLSPLEIATGFVALEWVRHATPLGMAGFFAVTQYRNPRLLQLAGIGGVWALGFLIAYVNGAIADALAPRDAKRRPFGATGCAAAMLVAAFGIGTWRLAHLPRESGTAAVAAIQLGQPMPSEAEAILPGREETKQALARGDYVGAAHRHLDEAIAATVPVVKDNPLDLVVWPEGLLPADPQLVAELGTRLREFTARHQVPIVVPFFSPDPGVSPHYDMLAVYQADGTVAGTYRKQRASYGADYTAGPAESPVFALPGRNAALRLGAVICFDFDFADVTRRAVRAGANLLAAPSDDAYPGIAAWHYAYLPLHSAMLGVPMIKADAAFVSAVTDSAGRFVAVESAPRPEARTVIARVGIPDRAGTFYSRTGDWLAWLCTAVFLALRARAWAAARKRR